MSIIEYCRIYFHPIYPQKEMEFSLSEMPFALATSYLHTVQTCFTVSNIISPCHIECFMFFLSDIIILKLSVT